MTIFHFPGVTKDLQLLCLWPRAKTALQGGQTCCSNKESQDIQIEKNLLLERSWNHHFAHNFWAPNFFEQNPLREITREHNSFAQIIPNPPFERSGIAPGLAEILQRTGVGDGVRHGKATLPVVSDIWRKCQENLLELMLAVGLRQF